MTSYEIASKILELRGLQDEGLIDEMTFNDTVESLAPGDKLNGLIYAVKRLEAEQEMLRAEKVRLDKELKRQEKNKETLKGFISLIMEAMNTKKFDGTAGKLSYRKSKSIEVSSDFTELHQNEEYVKKDITFKIDKKALKTLLEGGQAIEGAEIIEKNNLQIK